MATVSAGILMYHYHGGSLVVLLVHPRGPYWRNRDLGGWSIPKGELGEAEDAESAARREFKEELRPPRSGLAIRFPEIDRAAWLGPSLARKKILASQGPLLDRLETFASHHPCGTD